MKYQFTIKDMICGHCEQAITNAIKAIDSGAVVEIDRAKDSVTVNSIEPRDNVVNAITGEGYTVSA